MKKDPDDDYTGLGCVILVVALIAGFAFALAYTVHIDSEERTEWQSEEHTCPNCNWTGGVGLMRIVHHAGTTDYYCPECGVLLKHDNR